MIENVNLGKSYFAAKEKLEIIKDCGEAASPLFLSEYRRKQHEDKNKFELISIYSAFVSSKQNNK